MNTRQSAPLIAVNPKSHGADHKRALPDRKNLARTSRPIAVLMAHSAASSTVEGTLMMPNRFAITRPSAKRECGHLIWPHYGRCSARMLAPVRW